MWTYLKSIIVPSVDRVDVINLILDGELKEIQSVVGTQHKEYIDNNVIEELVMNNKNDVIKYLWSIDVFDSNYFNDEMVMRNIFHDHNLELFTFIIEKRLYDQGNVWGYNRLLLYVSENDQPAYAKVLIAHGAKKELLKIHNEKFYEIYDLGK